MKITIIKYKKSKTYEGVSFEKIGDFYHIESGDVFQRLATMHYKIIEVSNDSITLKF